MFSQSHICVRFGIKPISSVKCGINCDRKHAVTKELKMVFGKHRFQCPGKQNKLHCPSPYFLSSLHLATVIDLIRPQYIPTAFWRIFSPKNLLCFMFNLKR